MTVRVRWQRMAGKRVAAVVGSVVMLACAVWAGAGPAAAARRVSVRPTSDTSGFAGSVARQFQTKGYTWLRLLTVARS